MLQWIARAFRVIANKLKAPGSPTAEDHNLDRLAHAAADLAARDGSLEAIEKAASAIKSVNEARKAATEISREAWSRGLQTINAVFAGLAPLAAIAAVVATVMVSNQNRQTESLKEEATEWREFLTSIEGSKGKSYSDTTIGPRLASFFNSAQLHDKALSIGARILGQISDFDEFKELFRDIFPVVNESNIQAVIGVDKTLAITNTAVNRRCDTASQPYTLPAPAQSHFGLCARAMSDEDLMRITHNTPTAALAGLRTEHASVVDETQFTTVQIANYLRTPEHHVAAAHGLDLSDGFLFDADFSNVDFSNADMARLSFDTIEFDGAILMPANSDDATFITSDWWKARAVAPALLLRLIRNAYPYFNSYWTYKGGRDFTRSEYEADIDRLCRAEGLQCPPAASLGFGSRGAPADDAVRGSQDK